GIRGTVPEGSLSGWYHCQSAAFSAPALPALHSSEDDRRNGPCPAHQWSWPVLSPGHGTKGTGAAPYPPPPAPLPLRYALPHYSSDGEYSSGSPWLRPIPEERSW